MHSSDETKDFTDSHKPMHTNTTDYQSATSETKTAHVSQKKHKIKSLRDLRDQLFEKESSDSLSRSSAYYLPLKYRTNEIMKEQFDQRKQSFIYTSKKRPMTA